MRYEKTTMKKRFKLKSGSLVKISSVAVLISLALFIVDNQLNFTSYYYQQPSLLLSFNKPPSQSTVVPSITSFSPTPSPQPQPHFSPTPSPQQQPQLQSPWIRRLGILDDNGTMIDEFDIGDFDPHFVEDWEVRQLKYTPTPTPTFRVTIKKLGFCPINMAHYIPCFDTNLKSTPHRHCPNEAHRLHCLVPPPKGYKPPLPWPRSRGEVWFANAPRKPLVDHKVGKIWIFRDQDKLAQQYINQISKLVSNIKFGVHTRVALDIGCGVASFGAFLFSHNAITLSIAPKDVQDNHIQFSLERGVPAMVATFAQHRLLYPSQAFDLIHCSRCRINWTLDDGILLLEANRMLRAGGYFAWSTQPVDHHEEPPHEQWKEMEDLTSRLCWELVNKEGYIAIWRKPLNNICYKSRDTGSLPPLCDVDDDPDDVWYVGLKSCISRLPDNGYGANITMWPSRMQSPPDRLQSIQMDAYMARKELFKADSKYWNDIIARYIRIYRWKKFKLRNVMDMRAGFGGFAAALVNNQIDCWVMNVVPISAPNTLPVIYDRGLIGVMHDWCEPFDTYPRTYDLVHAAGLLSTEHKRCNISMIMLEIDRILRPGGHAYIRDSINLMDEIQENAKAMGWNTKLHDTAEGPHASWRVLMGEKRPVRA